MMVRALFTYGAMIVGLGVALPSAAMGVPSAPTITLHEAGVTKLQALIAIARLTKAPLGIVIGKDSRLCNSLTQVDLDQASLDDALGKVLSGLPYHTESHGVAIDVMPNDTSDVTTQLLSKRLGAFSPQPAPMHVLGVLFDGWLEMTLHPGSGWTAEIPSSTDAVILSFSTSADATAKDVLNALVSKDHGGLWIMQPQRDVQPSDKHPVATPIVEAFSYTDNDASLMSASCGR
jgi:hypothetical protein